MQMDLDIEVCFPVVLLPSSGIDDLEPRSWRASAAAARLMLSAGWGVKGKFCHALIHDTDPNSGLATVKLLLFSS